LKKYLIIGGAGFIGSNFAELILENKNQVTIFDNLSRRGTYENIQRLKEKYHSKINFIKGDIRSDLNELQKEIEVSDVVYHLAGQVAVTSSVINPREDFEINALGTFNVLESIRLSENKPIIIYASTNKVYGGMTEIEITKKNNRYIYADYPNGISEKQLLDFYSPYGCSKGTGDQYVRDYARIYGLKTVVMRQSCIYGSNQFGIEDQGWVAWFSIAAVLKMPITIFGDGMQVRDVLDVKDLFSAWKIAEENINLISGEVFNVGGGPKETVSLLELIDLLEKFNDNKIDLKFEKWRPGDQPVYISDISKIQNRLQWEPKIKFQDGVENLLMWIKNNKNIIEKVLKIEK
jgi:CDP-paratose 2-epimerase